LVFLFRPLGLRLSRLADKDESLQLQANVFAKPWLPAMLIVLIATDAIYPGAPESLVQIAIGLSVPVTIYLMLQVLSRSLHRMVYGLGALVLLFVAVRMVVPTGTTIERFAMLLVAVLALGSAAWFLRPGGATDALELSGLGRRLVSVSRVGLIILATSLIADTMGYVALAHHATTSSMNAIYYGLYFYVGSLILAGGATAFIWSRIPQSSRTVAVHSTFIQQRLTKLIFFGASIYWLFKVLDDFGVGDPLAEAVSDLLDQPLGIGDLEISAINILAFFVTLWISLKLAQIIRALLEEDILGRMELRRGLPNAVSALTFYFLVGLGFIFALSAAGLPLDRLALITGALGIGIGFGFQDIVRNFISGLILMIERPIRVGDIIEFGSRSGKITKIGIRASVVMDWEGSELIVPNGDLVASTVRNWTMSDNSRRIQVNMTVAYGSDPAIVTDVLLGVAREHKKIATVPAPAALFIGFGDRGMKFSLRCWVRDREGWLDRRHELSIESHKRLAEAGIEFPIAPIGEAGFPVAPAVDRE